MTGDRRKEGRLGTRWAATLVSVAAVSGGCAVLDGATRVRARRLARRGVTPHHAEIGSEHIKYWEGGVGEETVVFLHGFGGDALWQWYPQLYRLSASYHVIAPDLLWFGDSWSEDPTFSVQHQARAVLELLEARGVRRFHLLGLSYGGLVAHEVLGHAADRVDRVVLIASPARAFLADDKREVLSDFGVDSAADLLLPRNADELRRLMSLAYYRPPFVPRFVASQVVAAYYEPRRPEHLALLRAVSGDNERHRQAFRPPEQPTLIVWGERDRVFPLRAAFRLHEELGSRADLCVFAEAAHAPHLERSRDATRLIMRFLAGDKALCRTVIAPTPTPE